MNRSLLVGVAIGTASAVAAGAFAGYRLGAHGSQAAVGVASDANTSGPDGGRQRRHSPPARYARVVQVIPLTRRVVTPKQACRDVTVTHRRPAADNHQVIGSIAGALIGGLLGNQVGGGTGKDIATAAGVVAGGYAGNRIEKHIQDGNTYTTTERVCRTVYTQTLEPDGYRVRYRLNGREGTVRMAHDPGQRIPVRNGVPVLSGGQST
jgi:uncharacterized protein YcfJ